MSPTVPFPRPRRLVWLGIGVAWILFFLVLEIFVRIILGHQTVYTSSLEARPLVYSEAPYGRSLAPNFSDTLVNYWVYHTGSPLKSWKMETNRFGWREGPIGFEKPQNVRRLMLLGDSVSMGTGVDYFQSTSGFLAHALKLDSNPWEVLNRSVPGWDGWNELKYLESDGLRWKPDLVIVNVVMNDFKPESDADRERSESELHSDDWLKHLVFGGSHFLQIIRLSFFKLRGGSKFLDYRRTRLDDTAYGAYPEDKWWYIRSRYSSAAKEETYQRANRLSYPRYLDFTSLCKRAQVPYLIVVYPTASQTSKRYWSRQLQNDDMLDARPISDFVIWLSEHGLENVDLLSPFRKYEGGPLFIDETHPSPEGHRLTANAILKWMQQQQLVHLEGEPFFTLEP